MNIFNIGPTELLMILVIAIIVFGPNKIPEVGASIGKALRQFRDASRELTGGINLEDLNPSDEASADPAPVESGPAPAAEVAPEPPPAPVVEPAAAPAYAAPETPPPLVDPAPAAEAPRLPSAPQQRRFVVSREAWSKPTEDNSQHVEPD